MDCGPQSGEVERKPEMQFPSVPYWLCNCGQSPEVPWASLASFIK